MTAEHTHAHSLPTLLLSLYIHICLSMHNCLGFSSYVCFLYIYRLNLIKEIFTNKTKHNCSHSLYIYLYIYISTNISIFRSSDQSLDLFSLYLFANFFSFFSPSFTSDAVYLHPPNKDCPKKI